MWRQRVLFGARHLVERGYLKTALLIAVSILGVYLLLQLQSAKAFSSGTGTPTDPYGLATCADLQAIDDQSEYLFANYIVLNDIDCTAVVPFETIGNYQQFDGTYLPFAGRLDGNGYTISNVTVGSPSTTNNGLFAAVFGGSVRNLKLSNISAEGTQFVGALAGETDDSAIIGVTVSSSTILLHGNGAGYGGGVVGRMSDTYVYGVQATSSTVTSNGTHTTNDFGFGGIAGYIGGSTIESSAAGVAVTADHPAVGGVVGQMESGSVVKNTYSDSIVVGYTDVGGVVGSYGSTGGDSYIESVYSNASTTATTGYIGGILGGVSTCCSSNIYISNSFAVGKVASTSLSGAISGTTAVMDNNVYYPAGTGQTRCIWSGAGSPGGECTTNGSSSYFNDSANLPLSNWDFTNVWSEVVGDRPELQVFPFSEPVAFTAVTSCADLATGVRANPIGWFQLSNSIDCASDPNLLPLTGNEATSSAFYGTLDGQNYTISGIELSRTAAQAYYGGLGLFSKLYGATIENVSLDGAGVTALSRYIYGTGALAGYGHGLIVNNVSSTVPVHSGEQYNGGLIGFSSGQFDSVSVAADIDYTYPGIVVPNSTGGILGYSSWAKVTNATYDGNITGYWYVGGLVGYSGVLMLENATTTGSIAAATNVGGIWGSGGSALNLTSTLINAQSTMTLTPNHAEDGSFYSVGGLVGNASKVAVSDSSYAGIIDIGLGYGDSIGGLLGNVTGGNATSSVVNSYASSTITATGSNGTAPYLEGVGGLAGYADETQILSSSVLTNITLGSEPASGYISGVSYVGGLVGEGPGPLVVDDVSVSGSISIYEDISGVSGGNSWAVGGFGGFVYTANITNSTSSVDVLLKSYEPGGISNFAGDLEFSTISNLVIDGSLVVDAYRSPYSIGGLAGYATDLNVASTTVLGDITLTNTLWPFDIGGFIGYLESDSLIQQSLTNNRITIEAGSNGTSQGPYAVGGFIGEMSDTNVFRDTYASTSISITNSAMSLASAGGNIGGYVGYIGWQNNSITNSYASGQIAITADVTATFHRIGGFIGWSDWGTNTYTDNFSVGPILAIASSTRVGGFVGQYTGTETLDDNYFDQTTTLRTLCTGTDGTDPAWCFAENISSADPAYFYDSTNAPMSTWNFTSLWLEHPDTYPTFGVGGGSGAVPPTVTSSSGATSITGTSANVSGNITALGSGAVTARGFAYGTSASFGATTTENSAGFSTGSFGGSLTSLTCGTTYYFAAYAFGADGLDYGSTETFATSACSGGAVAPSLTTTVTVSAITETSALVQGNITSLGSATVTTRGFAYGLTSALGATTSEASAGFTTGMYTGTVPSLACGTTYFYQAYASGADGTGYGAQQSFSTAACPVASTGTGATRVVVPDVNEDADEDFDVVSPVVTPTTPLVLPPKPLPSAAPSLPPAAGQLVVCGENQPSGNPRRIVRVITNPPCNVSADTTALVANISSVSDSITESNSIPGLPENAELLVLPVTVQVTNEKGLPVDDFDSSVVIEISDARVLGLSQGDFVIVQPGTSGDSWDRLTFEVVGDTLRITVNRPGDLFIWFIPAVAEAAVAAEETGQIAAAPIQLSVNNNVAWYLVYAGLLSGLLYTLLQLARAPFSVTRLDRVLLEAWRNLIGLITFRKKQQPWGTVYDSVTKAPVDPAYVRIYNQMNEPVAEAITDLDGRYGFVVPEGIYQMQVQKTNYTFPSRNRSLTGKDVIYQQLYYGGEFSTASAVAHDIPMDPASFDWNQYEKLRTKQTNYFHKLDPFIIRFIDATFYVGLLFLVWQMLAAPSVYSAALLAIYGVLLILRLLGNKPPLYGSISDSDGPLQFALVHIMRGERVIYSKVTDAYGRYVAIVSPDTYTVRYQKRLGKNDYITVCERQINAKKGVINPRIKV